MDVLKFFRINKGLEERTREVCNSLFLAEGKAAELKEFNNYLKSKLDRLENILYKRFGLIREESNQMEPLPESVTTVEHWHKLRDRFERAAQGKSEEQDTVTKERQEYWRKRNEEIESQKKKLQEELVTSNEKN